MPRLSYAKNASIIRRRRLAAAVPLLNHRHPDVHPGGGVIFFIAGPWFARVGRITDQVWNYIFCVAFDESKVRVVLLFS